MALWNQNDSQWDNVPDADLTFSDYVTKLLRQPSTFTRPAFGGPFASTTEPAPVVDQTKMEGMFKKYLDQDSSSSYQPMGTNLTDAQWAAVKQLRDEQGWNNPYDVNSRKAFGQSVMGMLGGPVSFLTSAYRAQEPSDTAMSYLNSYMAAQDMPREIASLLGRYPAPTEVPVVPEELPVAQTYPVNSSGSSYTPSESYAASIASGWSPTEANYADGVYAGGTGEGE
jgi:hypothetical protein